MKKYFTAILALSLFAQLMITGFAIESKDQSTILACSCGKKH